MVAVAVAAGMYYGALIVVGIVECAYFAYTGNGWLAALLGFVTGGLCHVAWRRLVTELGLE